MEGQKIGIQINGTSSDPIYRAAARIIEQFPLGSGSKIADLGGGAGNFSRYLIKNGLNVTLFDYQQSENIGAIDARFADLNKEWPAEIGEFDSAVALEVVEHLENPRHFFREMKRIVKPGGYILLSTPNQLSFSSKICFFLRDQHQWFQDTCYPAHISAILEVDLLRISKEICATQPMFYYTNHGRIPGTRVNWGAISRKFIGRRFSDNILFSCRMAEQLDNA